MQAVYTPFPSGMEAFALALRSAHNAAIAANIRRPPLMMSLLTRFGVISDAVRLRDWRCARQVGVTRWAMPGLRDITIRE